MKRKFILTAFLGIISVFMTTTSSFAQNGRQEAQKVAWSLDAGESLNGIMDSGKVGTLTGGGQVSAVAMVLPQLGFRAGVGLGAVRSVKGDSAWRFGDKAAFGATISLDVMWDIISTFSKNNHKPYTIQPFLRIASQMGGADRQVAMSLGLGGGIRQVFRINDHIGILWDLNALASKESAWKNTDGMMLWGQTVVGISYTFRK